MSEKITFKTVDIQPEKFLNLLNPDTQIAGYENVLMYNTGIYGSKIDNAFPDLIIDLFQNGSAVNSNLINTKATLITGNNLQAEDDKKSAEVEPFIRKRNKSGENLQGVYENAASDMALFDAACLQVIFNREGKVAEVYHIPIQNFRLGIPNKYNQVEWGRLSNSWGIITNSIEQRIRDSVKIHMWAPDQWKKYPTQLMYIKKYSYAHYAVPSYNSSIPWIMIDREIASFHRNNIQSQFFLSMMITQVRGSMSDEEVAKNAEELERFYAGSKGRKALLSYVDQIADKPVVDQISGTEQDKVFDVLSRETFQHIITAHRAFPILGGFDGSGSDLGGDANKLNVSIMAFAQLVCEPMKQTLLDGFNRIFEVNQIPPVIAITEPLKLTQPIAGAEDLTRNERRAYLYGLGEIDESVNQVNNPNLTPE